MEEWKVFWHKVHRKYTAPNSIDFSELKGIVFKRDNNTCQTCGNTDDIVCHHRSYKHFMTGGEVEANDCITLCKRCHMGIHKNGNTMKHFAEEQVEWLNENKEKAEKLIERKKVEPKPKPSKPVTGKTASTRSEKEKQFLKYYYWKKKHS